MANGPPSELDSRPQSQREWSGWIRSLLLPLSLATALVAGMLYLRDGGGGAESEFGIVLLPAEKNPTGLQPAAEQGRAAPDFLLLDLDGEVVRLSDLQGSPIVVTFWASWCGACRAMLPVLADAFERHEARLHVLAVNVGESAEQSEQASTTFGVSFNILLDTNGGVFRTWSLEESEAALPLTFVLDASGVVAAMVEGQLTASALADALTPVLGESN